MFRAGRPQPQGLKQTREMGRLSTQRTSTVKFGEQPLVCTRKCIYAYLYLLLPIPSPPSNPYLQQAPPPSLASRFSWYQLSRNHLKFHSHSNISSFLSNSYLPLLSLRFLVSTTTPSLAVQDENMSSRPSEPPTKNRQASRSALINPSQ